MKYLGKGICWYWCFRSQSQNLCRVRCTFILGFSVSYKMPPQMIWKPCTWWARVQPGIHCNGHGSLLAGLPLHWLLLSLGICLELFCPTHRALHLSLLSFARLLLVWFWNSTSSLWTEACCLPCQRLLLCSAIPSTSCTLCHHPG